MRNLLPSSDSPPTVRQAIDGAAAGAVGGVVQVVVGLLLDKLFLPPRHDNNIAPRLVTRLFQRGGQKPHPVRDWVLGTLFHFGYAIGWGGVFGVARGTSGLPSGLLGGLMGLAIYALAFSR